MVILKLSFPAGGRWHATAWGTHVNEGIPDWPPAPWRLCRALIATWYLKDVRETLDEPLLRSLIGKLAEVLPDYALPLVSGGHTRHYMPIAKSTTKVFDTFLHVQGDVYIRWEIDLSDDERSALSQLCRSMGYLGRAESLVEMELIESDSVPESNTFNATPLDRARDHGQAFVTVKLLAPQFQDHLEAWRQSLGKATNGQPADLFGALHADTKNLQKQGWSQPPGSQWIDYVRPPLQLTSKESAIESAGRPLFTVARFAVVSQVAPNITQSLSLGERFHQSLVRWSDSHPIFTGRISTGEPLENHQHAFILSECNNHRGTIDFVTVIAKQGFDASARKALESIRKTWGYGGHDVQTILLGTGLPEDFGGLNREAGQCLPLAESKEWVSMTPFVPTRHPKRRKNGEPKLDDENLVIGGPEHDLRRLLEAAGHPPLASVESIGRCQIGPREVPPLKFQTNRKTGGGKRNTTGRGYAYRVTFERAVRGPIAVGYGAHFGLGLFVPVGVESQE